jgi:2-polyprenyl-6-hydroxyphenyl methylase/3-demethylubiquinone-9 3-methyltransferase
MRMMLRYDRYSESQYIDDFFFKNRVNLDNLEILDFGCGVGDYGMSFARKGAKVTFYDFKPQARFAEFRCKKENILCEKIIAPASHVPVYEDLRKKKYDLVIFGEILEHICDPFKILELFTEKGAKYIYTSSYPYKSKAAFEEKGHDINAFFQQEKCLKFLEKHYEPEVLIAKATMWCK